MRNKRKKKKRNEQNLKDLWDTFICAYAKCVPGVTKEEKDEVGWGAGGYVGEILFEKIMAENFPNLTQSINLDIQEIQQATSGQTQRDP